MKRAFLSVCVATALLGLSSCRSAKDAATLSSIDGEWNIIEINGAAVVPAPNQEFPFIGFETSTGKVYGSSSCNRIMGLLDVNAKPGTIDLGALATTRMACMDMTLEQNVLTTLNQVKKYKRIGGDNLALCGASTKRPLMVLQKRVETMKLADLNGKWMITEVAGEAVREGMERPPFLEFNIAEKRVHGNAGCNGINGGINTDVQKPNSLSFGQMISTMMACPEMELEGRILKAVNAVQTFEKQANGSVGLYDANGTLVLTLKK